MNDKQMGDTPSDLRVVAFRNALAAIDVCHRHVTTIWASATEQHNINCTIIEVKRRLRKLLPDNERSRL